MTEHMMKLKKRTTVNDTVLSRSEDTLIDTLLEHHLNIVNEYENGSFHRSTSRGEVTWQEIQYSFEKTVPENISQAHLNAFATRLVTHFDNWASPGIKPGPIFAAKHLGVIIKKIVAKGDTTISLANDYPETWLNWKKLHYYGSGTPSGLTFNVYNDNLQMSGIDNSTINFHVRRRMTSEEGCKHTTIDFKKGVEYSYLSSKPLYQQCTIIVPTVDDLYNVFCKEGNNQYLVVEDGKVVKRRVTGDDIWTNK